jgi:hypothetical protein
MERFAEDPGMLEEPLANARGSDNQRDADNQRGSDNQSRER